MVNKTDTIAFLIRFSTIHLLKIIPIHQAVNRRGLSHSYLKQAELGKPKRVPINLKGALRRKQY